MRSWPPILLLVLIAPLLGGIGWSMASRTDAPPRSPDSRVPRAAAVSTAQQRRTALSSAPHFGTRYVGAGGCAAAACHGDATPSNNSPAWKSSYTVWISQRDPHSIAYTVLRSERSKRMLWLLDGAKADPSDADDRRWASAAPHRDQRCLTCHSITPDANTQLPDHLLADGVSCEACHGPARRWRTEHTTQGWLARGPDRYQQVGGCDSEKRSLRERATPVETIDDFSMWNTKDLASRANICVRCHVGGADRDVNHDLIAAGHPRLNFEYAAFVANLPKHWNDDLDRESLQTNPASRAKKPADYEARLWAVGQLVSAEAAAVLLSQRAADNDRTMPAAWPELAEYDCFACHHEIKSPSWRRELVYSPPDAGSKRSERRRAPGAMPWGAWHFSIVGESLLSPAGLKAWNGADVTRVVRETMEQPIVSKANVVQPAGQLAASLHCLAEEAARRPITLADIDRCLTTFSRLPEADSWDEAAQRYLALVALTSSHARMASGSARLDYVQINARLRAIREELRFRSEYRSPAHFDMDLIEELRRKFAELVSFLAD